MSEIAQWSFAVVNTLSLAFIVSQLGRIAKALEK